VVVFVFAKAAAISAQMRNKTARGRRIIFLTSEHQNLIDKFPERTQFKHGTKIGADL
jgi:hypothetical protein